MKLDIYEIRRLAEERNKAFKLAVKALETGDQGEYQKQLKVGAAITAKLDRRTKA